MWWCLYEYVKRTIYFLLVLLLVVLGLIQVVSLYDKDIYTEHYMDHSCIRLEQGCPNCSSGTKYGPQSNFE